MLHKIKSATTLLADKGTLANRTTEPHAYNIGFAKKRASWLFEYSASHQLLWFNDNFEFRTPLLRKAKNRYRSV